jgi:hypothetical protein
MRHAAKLLAIIGLIGVVQAAPRATGANAANSAISSPVLKLRLTVSSDLSALSRRVLISEADAIWRDAHVDLRWLDGGAVPESGPSLRVLVAKRSVAAANTGDRWAVGELVRFHHSGVMAVASIASAERIVDESQAYQRSDVPTMREYRVGVVLGRAVAHEIGHYLLQSNAHSSYGLMRATIDAREFADLRSGAFRLDRESQAYLAARALATRSE